MKYAIIIGKAQCREGTVMITYKVPEKNRKDFIAKAARVNSLLMKALALFAIFAQSFNMARVVWFSKSGLGTLNNRIYFYLYFFCFICSCTYLLYLKFSKNTPVRLYVSSLIAASIWLFWNTILNIYDLYTSEEVQTIMVVTMIIAFSALIVMEPLYGLANIWINYVLFSYNAHFSFGQWINFTITALLASLIICVRFCQLCMELRTDKEMEEMSEKVKGGKFWLTKEQYELISHNIGLITFRLDLKNGCIIFSKNMEEILGKPFEIPEFVKFVQESPNIPLEYKKKILLCIENLQKKVKYQHLEIMVPIKNNTDQKWFKVQVVLQDAIKSEEIYAIGFMNDITEEKKKIFNLEKDASLDTFTGILNKASINAYGKEKMKIMAAKCVDIAMVIFDMDDFKYINDTFGHPCGDYVLKRVADILKENAPKGAAIGRLGGDEFIALLEMTEDNEKSVILFARDIIEKIQHISWEGNDVKARCSAGIAKSKCGDGGKTYEELYQYADRALYYAKNEGKNCVYEYSDNL